MRHVRMVPQYHLVAALAVLCFEKCGVCSVLKSSWKPVALVALALDALQPLAGVLPLWSGNQPVMCLFARICA